eukprot:scaffold33543_cov174-Skeletonema_dohrnii-CCMP3373.AAC.7
MPMPDHQSISYSLQRSNFIGENILQYHRHRRAAEEVTFHSAMMTGYSSASVGAAAIVSAFAGVALC